MLQNIASRNVLAERTLCKFVIFQTLGNYKKSHSIKHRVKYTHVKYEIWIAN